MTHPCERRRIPVAEAQKDPQEYELYDLKKDPGELNNLYGKPEYEGLVRQLRTRKDKLRRELADPELTSVPSR